MLRNEVVTVEELHVKDILTDVHFKFLKVTKKSY